ncbi:ribonuclease 3-like protein 1 [Ricinus communis]|uniref:Double-stranded RNA binding protein, putative n=1 Tax=Ricinus communis TaxID=3988 RepID=B9SMV4_RICCO|nr:ribonuclease 3-like protein 1 [Ricinus communis]EEF35075.1 double-stranded RNA binding protein, putative [Ricinus communis]|eukprot:XP_002527323.1 ribonuclease 3-like protein 1 [Ricinus communis]
MEKKCLEPYPQQKQSHINLKNLPPINPPTTSIPYYQVKRNKTITRYVPKVAKPRPEEEGGVKAVKFDHEANTKADILAEQEEIDDLSSVCAIKHIDSNNFVKKTHSKLNYEGSDNRVLVDKSSELKRVSAKSQLHEICVANNWKPPLYECCKEEGPCHQRLFTFKVIVEMIGAEYIVLECYGIPKIKKKTAAEHAAEGALWYLKHLGYFPINKWDKKKK